MKIHVRIQDKSFEVRIGDIQARPIQASVDGEIFEVWPEEMLIPTDRQQMTPVTPIIPPMKPIDVDESTSKPSEKIKQIKAPIPGVITQILVNEGDAVQYGQELCVLEAMKMKNSIRASRDGVIARILVANGDHVQHSQVLMEYQDEEA